MERLQQAARSAVIAFGRADSAAEKLREAIGSEAGTSTQKALAERFKVSPAYLNDVLRKNRPVTAKLAQRIADGARNG